MHKTASQIANDILVKVAEPRWMDALGPEDRKNIRLLREADYAGISDRYRKIIRKRLEFPDDPVLKRLLMRGEKPAVSFDTGKMTSPRRPGDHLSQTLPEYLDEYFTRPGAPKQYGRVNFVDPMLPKDPIPEMYAPPPPETHAPPPPETHAPPPKSQAAVHMPGPPKPRGMSRGKLLALGALGLGLLGAGGYGAHSVLSEDEAEVAQ